MELHAVRSSLTRIIAENLLYEIRQHFYLDFTTMEYQTYFRHSFGLFNQTKHLLEDTENRLYYLTAA